MGEPTRQRRERLLQQLRQDTVVTTRSLSDHLGVSEPTIRRDLEELEKDGLVERIHGGARLLKPAAWRMDKRELPFYMRREVAKNEKQAIARAALQLLEPDQVIMLDASTTCLYFAQVIPDDMSLTIITHSACLPIELAGRSGLQVICTGGILQPMSLFYLGPDSDRTLRRLRAHRAFFSVKGLTLREGCTDATLAEVQLKSLMVEQVHELIILADHTKLGNIALASFAPLSRVHTLVTDDQANPEMVQAIREAGVQVIIASLEPRATASSAPAGGPLL